MLFGQIVITGIVMHSFESLIQVASLIHNTEPESRTQGELPVLDKYTGEILASVDYIDKVQMEEAIESSLAGFEVLRKMTTGERRNLLKNFYSLIQKNKQALTDLVVAEAGKPIGYAAVEVERTLSTLEHSIEHIRTFGGEQVPMDFDGGVGKSAMTKRFPKGVIACISPFNFPLNLAMHKIAPAIAVGCSVLLKPSPYTPLTALALANLAVEAGFPAGAFNVVIAENEVSQMMIEDERIAHLSFTGSPSVGWMLKNICGKKSVTLELGGNAAVIVDETADLQQAAELVANGAYLFAGQICISTQRILVASSVYDDFKDRLIVAMEKIKVGDPRKAENTVGPLIDKVHFQRINSWVKEAISNGAHLLSGGKPLDENHNLYQPTLLENVNREQKVCCEEVFGPVAVLNRFQTFQEAIDEVNNSRFGLQAGVFTNDIGRMKAAFEALEVGGVMINNVPGFRIDHMPYGGIKDSGLGREGTRYVMEEFTEPRLLIF
ncbi:MAG: aldehyde dehydrogenase family protein [Deltaproteobacteria bacterium]|nr:MAG: aldehyde dehydrogenase family protein [Deltaproteobacteria bacterium]